MTTQTSLSRAADRRWVPWKNGGGVQADLLIDPPGADFETMDMRISIASIAASGPFSFFAGIDRSTLVLSGRGLSLTVADAAPVKLKAGDPPLQYPGDVATFAAIADGPLEVLNIMARRDRISHRLERHPLLAGEERRLTPDDGCLVWITGSGEIVSGDAQHRLGPQDALTCAARSPITIRAMTDGAFALASFSRTR